MALLWKAAMAWHEDRNQPSSGKPISVRKAGFAGYVAPHDPDDFGHGDEARHPGDIHGEDFDDDLYDSVRPEPTKEEEAHHEEHGEYPDDYYDRHDTAYAEAMDRKHREDDHDHLDEAIGIFNQEHGHSGAKWRAHGTYGKVDLTQPVYATQSHVHTGHIDRYRSGDTTPWHLQHGGHHNDYPANEAPLFATHEGRLHVTDGHHRVAAALMDKQPHMEGWHINLDDPKNKHLTEPDDEY